MAFQILDLTEFLTENGFREEPFLSMANQYHWEKFSGHKVLVRGCNSAVVPPWAFMYLTGKLVPVVQSLYFGNEHDHVVVFRKPK